MYYFLLLILFLLVMSYFREEGYLNYEELSFKGVKKNCPQIHANNFNRIVSPDRLEQFLWIIWDGKTPDDCSLKPVNFVEIAESWWEEFRNDD